MVSIRSWSIFFLIYFDLLEGSKDAHTIELRPYNLSKIEAFIDIETTYPRRFKAATKPCNALYKAVKSRTNAQP